MSVQLIDPYWTFIPVLITHLYAWACPDSAPRTGRQYVTLALIWLWSMRLTHSYLRRCSSAATPSARPSFLMSTSSISCLNVQPAAELLACGHRLMLCNACLTQQPVGGLFMQIINRPDAHALKLICSAYLTMLH